MEKNPYNEQKTYCITFEGTDTHIVLTAKRVFDTSIPIRFEIYNHNGVFCESVNFFGDVSKINVQEM